MTNPFPQGQQLLVGANSNAGTFVGDNQEGENSSNVYMMISHIGIAMGACDHSESETSKAKYVPETTEPLHIERPSIESIPRIPKGSTKRSTINPNARAAQNYSIVEDMAQIPCAMLALEVFQSCPTQRSALLLEIGAIDPKNSLVLTFDMLNVKKRLPHHMAFQIKYRYQKTNIFQTVIDEGASTCVMSMSCWKANGSPSAVPSLTLLMTFVLGCVIFFP